FTFCGRQRAGPENCKITCVHPCNCAKRSGYITSFVASCQFCYNICCIALFSVLFSAALEACLKMTDATIKIDQVEIRLIRLPLVEPFETSFGKIDSRLIFLVKLDADGLQGWGEVVASEEPRYSYETAGTAFHVIRDFLAPALLAQPLSDLQSVAACFAQV